MHRRSDPACAPRRPRSPVQWFVAARLRRRLFFVFAAVIVATAMVASGVTALLGEPGGWRAQQSRVRQFVSSRFADAWTDPPARARLAADIARDLRFGVELRDARGGVLLEQPPPGVVARCGRPWLRAPVRDAAGALAGEVLLCGGPAHWGPERTGMLVFAVLFVVWRMAGGIARRMARPFDDLVAVVRDLGEGRLDRRVRLGRHRSDEMELLARVINDMAGRIETQVAAQRELLAAVSHELRSPLARVRFLLEAAGDEGATAASRAEAITDVEGELGGIDALVGDLLAGSRLDFNAVRRVGLEAGDVARRAAAHAGLDVGCVDTPAEGIRFDGDATLLGTALANLLANATRHGDGVRAVRVTQRGAVVRFDVEDRGPGIPDDERPRLFDPFFRGARGASGQGAGLGLALVRRIAEAHGGGVWAENIPEGGARVGFSAACAPSAGAVASERA